MIFKGTVDIPEDSSSAIVESEAVGSDKFKLIHAQPIGDIMKHAYEYRKLDGNGFTDGKNMRKIASIPAIEFVKHPEWAHDTKAMKKWLKSEEGRQYLTVTKGV